MSSFLETLRERVVLFDGAMGTQIQAANLSLDEYWGKEGNSEVLNLSRPDVIADATNYIYYANANLASRPLILPEILQDPGIYPGEDILKHMFPAVDRTEDVQRVITRQWTRLKTGQ